MKKGRYKLIHRICFKDANGIMLYNIHTYVYRKKDLKEIHKTFTYSFHKYLLCVFCVQSNVRLRNRA